MPTLACRPPRALRQLATFALAHVLICLAAHDASAQLFGFRREYNQKFYGPGYDEHGYADAIGVKGHKRLENGGYYGPPQLYSRQYGTVSGYRTARPFVPPRNFGGTGYGEANTPTTY